MAKSVHIPKCLRRLIYGFFLMSWVTGITFFLLNRFVTVSGDFGPEKHPWQGNILSIHGGAAFLMMISFGYMLGSHVSVSWPVKRMRPSGLYLILATSFLIISAYILYYTANEELRTLVGYAHFAVGLSLPFLLILHLVKGRKRGNRGASAPA